MKSIIKVLSKAVANAAEFGSDSPSAWFAYQPEVPECLKKSDEE